MSKIYIASSWKNQDQVRYVANKLRGRSHEVYDFTDTEYSFQWKDLDENFKHWTKNQYKLALSTQEAENGFKVDFDAMKWCDICLLLLPCGRSAHLEAGWCIGQGKKVLVFLDDDFIPELMYKMCRVCTSMQEVYDVLAGVGQ